LVWEEPYTSRESESLQISAIFTTCLPANCYKTLCGGLGGIDKIQRRFLWAGDNAISGGKCKVNWTRTNYRRSTAALASWTSTSSPQSFACVGFGMSGFHQRRHGQAQRHHATKRIGSCLQLAPPSQWGTAKRRHFGIRDDCMVNILRILPHCSTSKQGKRNEWWRWHFMATRGSVTSTIEPALQLHTVGHTPRVLMQGRKKSRRRTPTRIPLYSY
jgi:hypothetical protein